MPPPSLAGPTFQNRGEQAVGWVVFGILVTLTYGLFFQIPYSGLYWQTPDFQIRAVFVSDAPLQPGDYLIQIGSLAVAEYNLKSTQPLFAGYQPGQTVPITIDRAGQLLQVDWTLPGQSRAEIWNRLSNQWWLAFFFWAAGQLGLLFIWPRTTRRQLFVAFCFLTALWLSASSVSSARIWSSPIILRSAIWLCVPVYWHFHWHLPKEIRPLPRAIVGFVYGVALVLAAAEWLRLLPTTTYLFGFFLALLGSLIILLIHFFKQPASRRDLIPLGVASILAIGLPLLTVMAAVAGITWQSFLVGFVSLPLLPFTQFYICYRQQEVRANQVATLYLFFLLIGTLLVLVVPISDSVLNFPGDTVLVAIVAAFCTSLLTLFGYQPFSRFVEHYILRIPISPTHLLHTYIERVTLSATQNELVKILTQEILPSLLIRQSALYKFDSGHLQLIYRQGVIDLETTPSGHLSDLVRSRLDEQTFSATSTLINAPDWVRLPLVLTIGGQPTGLWLLGHRDPDNQYPPDVVNTLIGLANQTAMALSNLTQTERVRALSQANIEQTESQRADLARDLHDNLLQVLAQLETNLDKRGTPPLVFELLDTLVLNIRQTISDLRPPILNFGLPLALESLADTLEERKAARIQIDLKSAPNNLRYDPAVELHLYRIAQQACENALRHAQATTITVEGTFEPQSLTLAVRDDGCGFELAANPNLTELVANKHYGLAGMLERAEIVKANLKIVSRPGLGTEISCHWTDPKLT